MAHGNQYGTGTFHAILSEQGQVVILVGADRINLGARHAACAEMCRFLAEIDFEGCGWSPAVQIR